jgi:acetyltransferase-like isoleucine patch superfamily enzyme
MKPVTLLRRFFMPAFVVSLICFVRYRAHVSHRAEVEYGPKLRLGRGTQISSYCKLKSSGGTIQIGRGTSIATGCFLGGMPGGLTIGENCLIGPNCSLLTSTYIYDDISKPTAGQGHTSIGTRIGNNVLLGAGTVVLDGSVIEDGVICAPNSVVSGRIPANTLIRGNPARVIFQRR